MLPNGPYERPEPTRSLERTSAWRGVQGRLGGDRNNDALNRVKPPSTGKKLGLMAAARREPAAHIAPVPPVTGSESYLRQRV